MWGDERSMEGILVRGIGNGIEEERRREGECRRKRMDIRSRKVEKVKILEEIEFRRKIGGIKWVVEMFKNIKERIIRIVIVECNVGRGNEERKWMNMEIKMEEIEGVEKEGINIGEMLVSNRIEKRRRKWKMKNKMMESEKVGEVIGIGKEDVEGEIIVGMRVNMRGKKGVEKLRRMKIEIDIFRKEIEGKFEDLVGWDMVVFEVIIMIKELKKELLIEDKKKNRRSEGNKIWMNIGKNILGKGILRKNGEVGKRR